MAKITDKKMLDWLDKKGAPNGVRFDTGKVSGKIEWMSGDPGHIAEKRHKNLRGAIEAAMRRERRKP